MNRATSCLAVSLVAASLAALVACEGGGVEPGAAGTARPATTTSAATTASASAAPAASEAPSAAPSASAVPSAEASASADTSASPTGSAPPTTSSAAPADSATAKSKYDCGGKGQKACPMQGWMKGVMGGAMQSGDNDKIAQALSTIAAKTPAGGYGSWAAIAAEGAAKAKSGDIDGAKAACKKCHSLYQKKYKDNQRDQPW